MKKANTILLLYIVLIFNAVIAQQAKIPSPALSLAPSGTLQQSPAVHHFKLDLEKLRNNLQNAKKLPTQALAKGGVALGLPDPKGKTRTYEWFETPVMAPELSARFPEIRSYTALATDGSGDRAYISIDRFGMHAMVRTQNETYYINKKEDDQYYAASKSAFTANDYQCLYRDETLAAEVALSLKGVQAREVNDGLLRTFRLALACTGEYAQFHVNAAGLTNASNTEKTAAVLSAMNTTMTRVNGIFTNDLGIKMVLIANNDQLIFLDPNTDNLTNNNPDDLLDEIQQVIDSRIGFSNYDIGHVFSTGNGGVAQLSSPCTSLKARGVSGLSSPVGEAFNIDFVAHEMGHQFGATHTFNNSCTDNRSSATAVEPGSGSTIMSYAGICAPNVQGSADAYFHAISIAQIWDNITAGNSRCAGTSPVSNAAPKFSNGSFREFSIPKGTAFALDALATDVNNDALTYTWEQLNNEITTQPPSPSAVAGPSFRSRPPSAAPIRYFPAPNALFNNQLQTTWEVIPTVERTLDFALIVRDNHPNLGQSARQDIEIHVTDTGAPFAVTSQSTSGTLVGGSTETITWNVAGTDKLPIGVSTVDIYLILNNNIDNLIPLTLNTPNDGTQPVVIPANFSSTNARIMVRAVDNIFLALNRATLSIQPGNFSLTFSQLEYDACRGQDLVIPFDYATASGFQGTVNLELANTPSNLQFAFSQTSLTAPTQGLNLTIKNTTALSPGTYNFQVRAVAASETKTYNLTLQLRGTGFNTVDKISPADSSVDVATDALLQWAPEPNATGYEVQLATDPAFNDLLADRFTNLTEILVSDLEGSTKYYWRVKPLNSCGEGVYGPAFSFTTIPVSCRTFTNNQVITINDQIPQTVTSTLNISDQGLLNSIRVGVNITHTYVSDLVISLISPSGTTAVLLNLQCDNGRNVNVVFDDEGSVLVCGSNPAISGVIAPQQALEIFKNEPVSGTWTLKVEDVLQQDGGSLNSFSLDLCVNGEFKPDSDGDGVFDEMDACPGTPAGVKVDVNGCEIFSLAEDNFLIRNTAESCRGNNDGSVAITANQNFNYTASLSGNGISRSSNFSNSTAFNDLPSGNYSLCITLSEQPGFEQCYDLVIREPQPIAAFKTIDHEKQSLQLQLQGSSFYQVVLNGITTQTSENTINLALKPGLNTLSIRGAKDCQGVITEEFFVGNGASLYPNPFQTELHILTSEPESQMTAFIYNMNGQLIRKEQLRSDGTGQILVRAETLPAGNYLLHLVTPKQRLSFKISKS